MTEQFQHAATTSEQSRNLLEQKMPITFIIPVYSVFIYFYQWDAIIVSKWTRIPTKTVFNNLSKSTEMKEDEDEVTAIHY